MFETVAPETFGSRSKRLSYETLPLSIAIHAAAIVGALVVTIWNVVFPTHSPRVARAYTLAMLPEVPPPPPRLASSPAPARAKPAPLPAAPSPAPESVAPPIIPELIPRLRDRTSILSLAPAVEPAGGAPDGVVGGPSDGELSGTFGGIAGHGDGRLHIGRDRPLPLYAIRNDYPEYPEPAILRRWEATVVVSYVIGTDGRVKEVTVIRPGRDIMFDEATVKAIRQWQFRPMNKDGQPIEVVHELTVYYQLIYR